MIGRLFKWLFPKWEFDKYLCMGPRCGGYAGKDVCRKCYQEVKA